MALASNIQLSGLLFSAPLYGLPIIRTCSSVPSSSILETRCYSLFVLLLIVPCCFPSLAVSTSSSHGPHLSCGLPWSSQLPPHTVPISAVAFPGRLNSLLTRSPSQLCPSLVVSTPSSHGPHLPLPFVFGIVPPRLSLQVFLLRNLAAFIVRDNVHQVGSILSETNFIITQLAMFYLLLRFDHHRRPSSGTQCSVVTAR